VAISGSNEGIEGEYCPIHTINHPPPSLPLNNEAYNLRRETRKSDPPHPKISRLDLAQDTGGSGVGGAANFRLIVDPIVA
jgi:hypothetical protein